MLMQKPTPEMLKTWQAIFEEYKTQLCPNRKTAQDMIEYLKQKYQLVELVDEKHKEVVVANVMLNQFNRYKLPEGKIPVGQAFCVENTDDGKTLYEHQDDIFGGLEIFVGIELETGYFIVEGSSLLWDELFAFRGLDKNDLDNCFLVAEYISCLKKFDMLDGVLKQTK